MPEDSEGQTPAIVPVTKADLDALASSIAETMNKRFVGFQQLVAKRDVEIETRDKTIRELKTAGMSEDELEQLTLIEREKEIESLKAKIALNELSATYGKEVPFFTRLIEADSMEDQLAVMAEYGQQFQPAPIAPAAEPAVEGQSPEVDPNRAQRTPEAPLVTLPDGSVAGLTDAIADRVLAGFGNVPQARFTQRDT